MQLIVDKFLDSEQNNNHRMHKSFTTLALGYSSGRSDG